MHQKGLLKLTSLDDEKEVSSWFFFLLEGIGLLHQFSLLNIWVQACSSLHGILFHNEWTSNPWYILPNFCGSRALLSIRMKDSLQSSCELKIEKSGPYPSIILLSILGHIWLWGRNLVIERIDYKRFEIVLIGIHLLLSFLANSSSELLSSITFLFPFFLPRP